MSIGNLKTEGNKGNNFPWQYKVLVGLQGIIDELQNGSDVTIVGPLGSQSETTSVSVAIASDQYSLQIVPVIIISSGDVATIITDKILSISFASNGTADALVTFDGTNYVSLPTGTTVNMDAGGINNSYVANCFGYDTDTNAGASLIITYNTI